MAEVIRMPRLSDTMEEGVIVAWHKKVGDKVSPGDILAEVETDKATMDLENFHEGYLLYIGVKEGPVPVDGILAVIGKKGEDYQAALEKAESENSATAEKQQKPAAEAAGSEENTPREETHAPAAAEATGDNGEQRVKASPLARSMAKEIGLDITAIQGTGDQGRVIKRDIEQAATRQPATGRATRISTPGGYDDFPLSQMRKTIARRLVESKFTAPHFYLTMEIDMSQAVIDRKQINQLLEESERISFNDLVVKACALALRQHPKVNASWMDTKIRQHHDIHVGVAVAIEDGLLVPVLRNTDFKSLTEIHSEVVELAGRARQKRLQPEEMQGSTFTVSNLGMFGIDEFTAIINPPDACILAVGSIVEKPVVRDGVVTTAHLMKVTLSCDHRVVDGATGARFLTTVRQFLQSPVSMLA